VLHSGGPVSIAVAFPTTLNGETPAQSPAAVIGSTARSLGGWLGLAMLGIFLVGAAAILRRRRSRGAVPVHLEERPGPAPSAAPPSPPASAAPPPPPAAAEHRIPAPATAPEVAASSPVRDLATVRRDALRMLTHGERFLLRVEVHGPLRFEPRLVGLSDPARALLSFLALHRVRPRSSGELLLALWLSGTTERDVSLRTLQNYVSEARRAVGAEVLPEVTRGAGYQLLHVTTDAEELVALVALAKTLPDAASLELRRAALDLVREHPFATESSSHFEWVRAEGIEARLIRDVVDLADDLAFDLRDLGDLVGAENVLRQGLLADPSAHQLWEQLVAVVAGRGDSSATERLWSEARARLGEAEAEQLRTGAGA